MDTLPVPHCRSTLRCWSPRRTPSTPKPTGPPWRPWEEVGADAAARQGVFAPVHRVSFGARNRIVIAPGDSRSMTLIPDKCEGYCQGVDGRAGPNLACDGCGRPVATRTDDCWNVADGVARARRGHTPPRRRGPPHLAGNPVGAARRCPVSRPVSAGEEFGDLPADVGQFRVERAWAFGARPVAVPADGRHGAHHIADGIAVDHVGQRVHPVTAREFGQ